MQDTYFIDNLLPWLCELKNSTAVVPEFVKMNLFGKGPLPLHGEMGKKILKLALSTLFYRLTQFVDFSSVNLMPM